MPVDKIHLAIDNYQQKTPSSYQATMARFDRILKSKLGRGQTSHLVTKPSVAALSQTVPFSDKAPIASRQAAAQLNLLTDSGASIAAIDRELAGTPLQGLGETFKRAELTSGVNAMALAAMAIHESAYGKSSIAQNKNNLFGLQAYDDNPYGHAKSYASFSESISDVADYLSREYLSKAGKYYRGTTLQHIGQNYASDPLWSNKVAAVLSRMASRDE